MDGQQWGRKRGRIKEREKSEGVFDTPSVTLTLTYTLSPISNTEIKPHTKRARAHASNSK